MIDLNWRFGTWCILFKLWQSPAERSDFLTTRSTCLFLFFVPSQWWVTSCLCACFTACFGGYFNTSFLFLSLPSHSFISSFFTYSPPPSVPAYMSVSPLVSPPSHHQLQLWDTAGQERFRKSMVQHYYRNVHAVLFVYDVTCPASFSSLTSWIEECRQNSLGQEIPR